MKNVLYFYYDEEKKCTILVYPAGIKEEYRGTCREYLEESCEIIGASLETREAWAKRILKKENQRKVPILVIESTKTIFFNVYKGLWVQFRKIEDCYRVHNGNCIIEFCDGSKLRVQQSTRTVYKHLRECRKLCEFLDNL